MFIFFKLLLFLFRPLIWTVVLFACGLLTKHPRRKRITLRLAFAFLIIFSNPFLIRTLLTWYEAEPTRLSPSQQFETGIVLGWMVSYSPQDSTGYFNNVSDRFIQTALLYKQGHIRNVIVAAGNGYLTHNDFSEAGFIKRNLIALGVPATDIYADSASRNTLENAVQAKRLADSLGIGKQALLITSAMHMPRAKLVFQKAGFQPVPYPCNFLSREGRLNFLEDVLLPSSQAFTRWDNLIKEWLGIAVYRMTGKG